MVEKRRVSPLYVALILNTIFESRVVGRWCGESGRSKGLYILRLLRHSNQQATPLIPLCTADASTPVPHRKQSLPCPDESLGTIWNRLTRPRVLPGSPMGTLIAFLPSAQSFQCLLWDTHDHDTTVLKFPHQYATCLCARIPADSMLAGHGRCPLPDRRPTVLSILHTCISYQDSW